MNSSRFGRVSRVTFSVALLCYLALRPLPVAMAEPDPPKSNDFSEREKHLITHWKKQRDSLESLHVKYNVFAKGSDFNPLSPEEVLKIFDPELLTEVPAEFKEVQKKLLNRPLRPDTPWGVGEFYTDTKRTREERGGSIHVFDGEDMIHRDGDNRQITLGEKPGQIGHLTCTWESFCNIPDNGELFFGFVKYVDSSGERERHVFESYETLNGDVSWLEVNKSTGMIERSSSFHTVQNRDYGSLIIQGGWLEYAPGLYWPRVHGDFGFQGEPPVLRHAFIYVCTEVDINKPVDEGKFIVAAVPGDTVFDRRKEGNLSCYQVPDGADDVKKTSE